MMSIRLGVGCVLGFLILGAPAWADSAMSTATPTGLSHFAQLQSDFFDANVTTLPDLVTAVGRYGGNCFYGHTDVLHAPDQNLSVACSLTISQESNGPLFPARTEFYITCPNSAGMNTYGLIEAALTSDGKAYYSAYHFIDADWQCSGDPSHPNPALDPCSGHTSFMTAQYFLRRYTGKDTFIADFVTRLNGSYYPQYDPNAYCYFQK